MPELKPLKGGYYVWHYIPSNVAAIIFLVLFVGATGYHCWRIVRTRTWFCIVFAIGGLLEIIGYAARATARDKTDQLMPYIIQSVMILIAPALFAASIYMTLGRIMRSVDGERHSFVPAKWLTRIFVCGDVFSFLVQSSGAGIMVKGNNSMKMGENLVVAGLFIQVAIFGVFWATAVLFHIRIRRWPTGKSLDANSTWKASLNMLYGVSALIMIRSIFRIIEYLMGSDGYPLRNEWTLYVFDSVLMFGVMVIYGIWFPRNLQAKKLMSEETDISLGNGVDVQQTNSSYQK